jgi:hypothetical protein
MANGGSGTSRHPAPGLGVRLRGHRASDLGSNTPDVHPAGIQVEGIESKADALAPPETGATTERHHADVSVWDHGEQLPNEHVSADGLVVRGPTPYGRQRKVLARAVPDDPVT